MSVKRTSNERTNEIMMGDISESQTTKEWIPLIKWKYLIKNS